jgi:RimJ/RimL family protein N-acetyltransferase
MHSHLPADHAHFRVRQATEQDAEKIIAFARIIFATSDQVLTTPEEYNPTYEQEKAWINGYAANPGAIILVAEAGDAIVGLLDFTTRSKKKINHTGEFGVSVHPDFRGKGIGRSLITTLLKWAGEIPSIEKVCLQVFNTNTQAIHLYNSLGFREEGRHIRAIRQPGGEYVDLVDMAIMISRDHTD